MKDAPAPLLVVERFAYPVDANPARNYLLRLGSAASRRTVEGSLQYLATIASGGEVPFDVFPWHSLRYPETLKLHGASVAKYSANGARSRVSALRGVLREAWRLEQIDGEAFHRAIDLPKIRGRVLARGRQIAQVELAALFESIGEDSRPMGARDLAIIALGYGGGLRRSEIVATNLEDLDVVARTIKVTGKGRRQRSVKLQAGAVRSLYAWVGRRGDEAGPLFYASTREGNMTTRRLSSQAIRHICRRRAKRAGVKDFAPHDLRRSHGSDLLDAGVDISLVRVQLGHEQIETTAIYDLRGDSARHAGIDRVAVPTPQ